MQYVQIAFKGNYEKLYDYMTDLDLKVGKPVVVPTGFHFSVGTVHKIIAKSSKATGWVVQKVDVKAHQARLQREKELEDM